MRLTDRGWFALAVIAGALFGIFLLPHTPVIWWG